ncbi:general stress protein CsbD [Galbibacter sp. BG1]|uniref:general stress protein CsbD n=1 Tax=Galbibacter sp. BG1 TaxID=1170699 RepID=UPI002107CBF8|nr:general stress protein CsbD [Galbibacter sp. BG1]
MEKRNERENPSHDRKNENQDRSKNLEKKWKSIKGEYRGEYQSVTDEDVNYNDGDFEGMLDRLSRRRGISRSQVKDEIDNW